MKQILPVDSLVNFSTGIKSKSKFTELSLLTEEGPKTLSKVSAKSYVPMINIETDSGQVLEVAESCKFRVLQKGKLKDIAAKDLKIGDLLVKQCKLNTKGTLILDKSTYYLLGVALFSPLLNKSSIAVSSHICESSLFIDNIPGTYEDNGKFYFSFPCSSDKVSPLLSYVQDRTIPIPVFNSDLPSRSAFLSGVFNKAGQYFMNKILLPSSYKNLILQVQELLNTLGIDSYVSSRVNPQNKVEYVLIISRTKSLLRFRKYCTLDNKTYLDQLSSDLLNDNVDTSLKSVLRRLSSVELVGFLSDITLSLFKSQLAKHKDMSDKDRDYLIDNECLLKRVKSKSYLVPKLVADLDINESIIKGGYILS